jgi:hypothetical protein
MLADPKQSDRDRRKTIDKIFGFFSILPIRFVSQ